MAIKQLISQRLTDMLSVCLLSSPQLSDKGLRSAPQAEAQLLRFWLKTRRSRLLCLTILSFKYQKPQMNIFSPKKKAGGEGISQRASASLLLCSFIFWGWGEPPLRHPTCFFPHNLLSFESNAFSCVKFNTRESPNFLQQLQQHPKSMLQE